MPETDEIFQWVHEVNNQADTSVDELRVSMDAKATVHVGDFSRGGVSRVAVEALDHDFKPDLKLTPVGILLPEYDQTFFSFVSTTVTADCLVDVLENFWRSNQQRFPEVKRLVINLDNGPETHSRRTQFIKRIVGFSDRFGIDVRLAYYPPYHSKYNPIERVWGVLENSWNGDLLNSVDAVIGHAKSMTWNGIHPVVGVVKKVYANGKKLTKAAMDELEGRLERWPGLERWFVEIAHRPLEMEPS